MKDGRVVLITAPDEQLAHRIARGLVAEKLAACVNVVPGITSHYRWEGKVCKDAEWLLVAKTRAACLKRLIARVKKSHPAQIPEIVALPILEGDAAYLSWLGESVA